jgi:hypothetical protein
MLFFFSLVPCSSVCCSLFHQAANPSPRNRLLPECCFVKKRSPMVGLFVGYSLFELSGNNSLLQRSDGLDSTNQMSQSHLLQSQRTARPQNLSNITGQTSKTRYNSTNKQNKQPQHFVCTYNNGRCLRSLEVFYFFFSGKFNPATG